MNPKVRRFAPIVVLVLVAVLVTIWLIGSRNGSQTSDTITASGTVETVEVTVSPELAGRVAEVLVAKGDAVTTGQPLVRLDDTLLQAQRKQALAAVDTAQGATRTAKSAWNTTQKQYQQVFEAAQLTEAPVRTRPWTLSQPWEFDQPDWYYGRAEQIDAMQSEADDAQQAWKDAEDALQTLLDDPQFAGLREAEERIARARAAFLVAQDAFDQADSALTNEDLRQAAQDRLDAAKEELDDAQSDFDSLAGETWRDELSQARAEVRAAEDRYNLALDRLASLHTGVFSPAVQVAEAAVQQAQDASSQADLALAQAQTQLDLIDAQIAKLTVYAPIDGVVLNRNVEPGEIALAGSSVLVVGRLDQLTLTVYVPEERYGEIRLGQAASVTVDSFADRTFPGEVTRIADRAEFTPRNVQTEEGRRTTVFAVEIAIDNADGSLKPGMPADVTFQ
jgi:HlyD family secretion protein